MIRNQTPYLGKVKWAIEKYPHYQDSTILNKIHFRFGPFKIVSRIIRQWDAPMNSWTADPEKIDQIQKYTGGFIDTYCGLNDSFLHPNGTYIGNLEVAWWYVKKNFVVTNKKPSGVALSLDRKVSLGGDFKSAVRNEVIDYVLSQGSRPNGLAKLVRGYYGYSHRGGCLFTIGDKIFDESWRGGKSDQELDNTTFKQRGDVTISNWEQAERAAINFSNYLS